MTISGPVQVHYVAYPPEIRKRRLAERGNPRDLAKLWDWEEHIQYYEESPPVFEHILI